MENIFAKKRTHDQFDWSVMAGIEEGRGDLGLDMPVLVYRLMQYTMLEELTKCYGLEKANNHFKKAGHKAGSEYAKNELKLDVDFNTFVANLQASLKDLKIGILRIEVFEPEIGRAHV